MARGLGRKIDNVKFEKDGFTINVPIYLKRDGDEEPSKYSARLVLSEPPIDIKVDEADLDAARKKIKQLLEQQVGLKWEDWLLVRVSGEEFHPGSVKLKLQNGLDVHYTHVQVADVPGMGKVHRFPSNDVYGNPWGKTMHAGIPDVEVDPIREKNLTKAFIKNTKENMAAIEAILRGIDDLREKLRVLLSPKQIEHTLLNINKVPLLGLDRKAGDGTRTPI